MTPTGEQLAELQQVNNDLNVLPFRPDDPVFGEAPDTWKFAPDGKGWDEYLSADRGGVMP